MTKAIALVAILFTTGCCFDLSTRINVAPSAHNLSFRIERAVKRLNRLLGQEVFTIEYVTSETRVDNEIIIRQVSKIKPNVIGTCNRTRRGIIINLLPNIEAIHVAHELGHAMGLDHHADKYNIMYYAPTSFNLTPGQIDHILIVPES